MTTQMAGVGWFSFIYFRCDFLFFFIKLSLLACLPTDTQDKKQQQQQQKREGAKEKNCVQLSKQMFAQTIDDSNRFSCEVAVFTHQ
jgi:hypothetical protein